MGSCLPACGVEAVAIFSSFNRNLGESSGKRVALRPHGCKFTTWRVMVSFARHGRSRAQSFPRKRESTARAIGNAPPREWIPAFAGMTGVSRGIRFQMTPQLPGAGGGRYASLKAWPGTAVLLHCNAFGEVPGRIDVAAAQDSAMISESLKWNEGQE